MRSLHRTLAVVMAALLLLSSIPVVNACGPEYITPIFVFESSPDIPFREFTSGKIGIVRPGFGRKTLAIAYRFLNGGSFTADVQDDLLAALNGKAPEDEGESAVKAWIEARKEMLKDEQSLPEIYTERKYTGYDFFPNCAKNAFEVALETLKNRASTYGADDKNVLAWLAAQDTVFQNCSGGSHVPAELGQESPAWLRKDRDYQIAAAFFYSLNFDEARARFEKIAGDYDSPWQPIAPYLVARTFVRQASLERAETKRRELYEQAEARLQTLSVDGSRFAKASMKLLGLVKYHLHPEERVVELGRVLARGNDENVRQDLIDYVWLLDKFEAGILKAEEERKKKLNPSEDNEETQGSLPNESRIRYERIQRGELIELTYFPLNAEQNLDIMRRVHVVVEPDTPLAEIVKAFEAKWGRPATPQELEQVKQLHASALSDRQWRLSPNRTWQRDGLTQYEGAYWNPNKITLDLVPKFLHADDLSDWILTLQTNDPAAYRRASRKWRQNDSPAWLLAGLIKAETSSPRVRELMRAAEKLTPDDPAYATAVYHLVRLKAAMGELAAARRLLDEVISQSAILPVSARNQFLEQRSQFAAGLNDFLNSAQRKPIAFQMNGIVASLHKLFEIEKRYWNPEYMHQTKEEYEQEVEDEYRDLLPWDDRVAFDDPTADILNWHFSLPLLVQAARKPDVPDYLKRKVVLAAWTRAILLNEDKVALEIAPDVLKVEPEMSSVLKPYIESTTAKERRRSALYVLLKWPTLSPYISSMLQSFPTVEGLDYSFEEAWWCPLPETDYDDDGKQVAKVVPKPAFLTAAQLEAARRERRAMIALGDGKSYLGKQVLAWARSSPDDPRLPEALYIATIANESYKYGCDGWSHDEETRASAEALLRERYPLSSWTVKLSARE